MGRHRIARIGTGLLLAMGVAAPVAAQQATLVGTVTDAQTGAPIEGARVELLADQATVASTITGRAGTFRFASVEGGRFTLAVSRIGYRARRISTLILATDDTRQITVSLTPQPLAINPFVVSASRTVEKALDAPASVSVIDARHIQERAALTASDHVYGVPGIDVATTGLTQHEIVARGFSNVASGALLVLTDSRYASLPSLRINTYNFIPTGNDDIERIELVRGPGSALYGPNSANGVMHIITRSPFDSPGTVVSVTGGEQSLIHGSIRHAARVSDRVAFKISGQYLRGTDWAFSDPEEARNRQNAILQGADPDTLLVGRRDPTIERIAGELRVDWRPDAYTSVVTSFGANNAIRNVDITPLGAAQVRDWWYTYAQARLNYRGLFAQVFVNASHSDETYLLRLGEPVADKSRMLVAQLQHGVGLGSRATLRYGADLQRTVPQTDGTITGRNEDDDIIDEAGAYAHAEVQLTPSVQLVAAGRIDYHSRLEDPVLSPRAALVYQPRADHSFRLTYNRAFGTPTSNDLFLDLLADSIRIPLTGGALLFAIRVSGVPETGFTFARDCGGPCMRSPFTPADRGGPGVYLPLDATLLWQGIVDTLKTLGIDLSLIPAPDASQVSTNVFLLDGLSGALSPVTDLTDIPRLRPTITNTLELGYKGVIADRMHVALDVHRTWKNDFVGPLKIETPSVFFDPTSLASYLAGFVPADSARILAALAAQLPVGTVSPREARDPWDLIITYRNFGQVALWGVDAEVLVLLTPELAVRGTYSWLSDDFFPNLSGLGDVALNASANKGSVAASYRNEQAGLFGEARFRAVAGYPVNSGLYVGDVESYAVVDASVGYRLPFRPHVTVSLHAQNLLDYRHREFVGTPEIGRLVLGRVRAEF